MGKKMNQAREYLKLNEHDDIIVADKKLQDVCTQINQNYDEETTAYIFSDGSALIASAFDNFDVCDDYGLHCDYIQL
jgi:hypothetical protein